MATTIERILDYREGRIALTDDPEVFAVVANLPLVRELQRTISRLRSDLSELDELRRFMEDNANSFCAMWQAFKEAKNASPTT